MNSSKYMNKIRSFDVDQVDSLISQLDTLNLNKYDNEVGASFGFIPRLSSPFCSISWREKSTKTRIFRLWRNSQLSSFVAIPLRRGSSCPRSQTR